MIAPPDPTDGLVVAAIDDMRILLDIKASNPRDPWPAIFNRFLEIRLAARG